MGTVKLPDIYLNLQFYKFKYITFKYMSKVEKTAQLNKFYLMQWQRRGALFYLWYMIILFKFEILFENIPTET